MARNGSGTYTNPYPNFVSGTVISSTEVDTNNSQIATALTQSIAVDGQAVVTADLPLATHKFTGMKVGTASTDSLSLGQAQAEAFVWCGTAGGSADAITLTPAPPITAYAAGQRFVWMASGVTNTTATTVAISGLGTIALQDNGAALTAGQHAASKMFMGILNTASTVQIMQVQVSGTDPLIVTSLTVSGDATIGDDLTLLSDSSILGFGTNTDVKITHVHDSGLEFKNTSTGENTPFVLLIQTGEIDVAAENVLGKIQFQAPDEAAGTDAILVAAEIAAVSEGDFSASNNATKLAFKTGASEAATEKMSISSVGNVTMKETETSDDTPMTLLLQTGEIDIAASDVLGKIQFQAPDEAQGTDAILVAAEIAAVSEGDFAADNNATKLSFKTGASEAATEKMLLSSGGNLSLTTDAAVVNFGVDSDVKITHVHDSGLTLKNTSTADDTPFVLLLQTGETDIVASDVLGKIQFQAPDEAGGTDAILVAAEIEAVSEGTFAADNNATRLSFNVGASEAAVQQMSLSSTGVLGFASSSTVLIGGTTYGVYVGAGALRSIGATNDNSTYAIYCSNSDATTTFYVRNDGRFATGVDGGSPYNLTTGTAENVFVSSNGSLYRSTSSARFKTNVESIEDAWADKILDMQPIYYKSIATGDVGVMPENWTHYGFSAEQVATVDPRLVSFKTHDYHMGGAEGDEEISTELDEPIADGVQYTKMIPALVNLIKRQRDEISALTARVLALET